MTGIGPGSSAMHRAAPATRAPAAPSGPHGTGPAGEVGASGTETSGAFWADLHESLRDPTFRANFLAFAAHIAEADALRNNAEAVLTYPTCDALYEPVPDNRRDSTHTCNRRAGHEGDHHCPLCRSDWAGGQA